MECLSARQKLKLSNRGIIHETISEGLKKLLPCSLIAAYSQQNNNIINSISDNMFSNFIIYVMVINMYLGFM